MLGYISRMINVPVIQLLTEGVVDFGFEELMIAQAVSSDLPNP